MMKKVDLISAYNIFEMILEKNKKNVKFNYLVAINKSKIEPIKKIIENIQKPSESQTEYERRRIEVCQAHCDKDENGEPVIKDVMGKQIYSGLNDNEEFKKRYNELNEECKSVIEEIENKQKQLSELLNEDEDIDWKKIDIDLFPDDLLEGNIIEFFIKIGLIKEI